MAQAAPRSAAEFARKAARTARWGALAAMIAIGAGLALAYGADVAAALRQENALPRWLHLLNALLPPFFFLLSPLLILCGLWRLRRALGEYAQGRFFSPLSARAVGGAGDMVVAAVIVSVLAAPVMFSWEHHTFGGFVWTLEAPDLALLVFALFLAAAGRVLAMVAKIKTENEAFV